MKKILAAIAMILLCLSMFVGCGRHYCSYCGYADCYGDCQYYYDDYYYDDYYYDEYYYDNYYYDDYYY